MRICAAVNKNTASVRAKARTLGLKLHTFREIRAKTRLAQEHEHILGGEIDGQKRSWNYSR